MTNILKKSIKFVGIKSPYSCPTIVPFGHVSLGPYLPYKGSINLH